MKAFVYSRWDGSQDEFKLDADRALDALSELMMHGLNVRDAMQYMRQYGFDLAGQDFRVMGTQELTQALRKQMRQAAAQYNMREATSELKERFEDLLGQEEQAVQERHGFESRKMNDFMERRHAPSPRLAQAIAQFQDYEFEDRDAAEAYEELRQELERLRALEEFLEQHKQQFRGRTAADYETAQRIREQFEANAQMLQALQEGRLSEIDPEQLGELLGDQAQKSLIVLRDLDSSLRERGYLRDRDGHEELTPTAVRRIGAQALAQVYGSLRKGRQGSHATSASGAALPRPDETRAYRFGDGIDIDVVRSLMNALQRGEGRSGQGVRLQLSDLEVREKDFSTQATTVLLLDLSWSMSFEGRFPAAKRVALAMHQLIRTQFPRDHFFIVGFSTRARELRVQELPEVSWDPGDPFTNLQEGLMVAERLISKHPSPSPQILVITDGQPTAYFVDDELHVEWPSGYGGISPRAVAQTLKTVRRITTRGITINTFMLHDSPELVGFVERLTEINHGRALFTDPQRLGSYVLVDHLSHRRRRR
jgi:Mg-chelatase subunit ChlD